MYLTTAFSYYQILMLINTFDDVYMTALASSFSELVAYAVGGVLFEKLGVKLSLFICFSSSALGGFLILLRGLDNQNSAWFLVIFLFVKFGISATYNINYAANSYFFPTLFKATAMGFCFFLASFFTAFSYLVAGLEQPAPMIVFTCLTSLAAVMSLFLKMNDDEKPKVKSNDTTNPDDKKYFENIPIT